MHTTSSNTLEGCLARFATAPVTRQQSAISAFRAALEGRQANQPDEPFLSLKDLGKSLGYHPSHLWRLGINAADEGLGGRPKFRRSKALEYLKSPACLKRREALRAAKSGSEVTDYNISI
jgi:hypothetical protein